MEPAGQAAAFWAALGIGAAVAALVVAVLIWRARGRSRQELDERRAYLQGVRHLLSDDPDAAIEALTRVVRVNTEAVETYFALGSLFRRKGDIERAIRIHENILLRPGLPDATRNEARFQLAMDYRKAGMLSQARDALAKVVEGGLKDRDRLAEGLAQLRDVCLEAGDVAGAADAQRKRMKVAGDERSVLAHLLAAVAREHLAADRRDEARAAVKEALRTDAESVDAHLAAAELAVSRDAFKDARQHLDALFSIRPEAALLAWPLLESLYWRHERFDELGDYLREQVGRHPRVPYLRLVLARHLRRMGLTQAAVEELRVALDLDPRFHDARQDLGRILLDEDMGDELRRQFQALLEAIGEEPAFRCERCGHAQPDLVWRCPRCGAWDSFRRTGYDEPEHPARALVPSAEPPRAGPRE